MTRRRSPLTVLLAAAALLAVVALPGTASAQEQLPAQLRLAHFSPDTPPMDVYVTGFDGQERRVLDGLGYRQVSQYLDLDAGFYTFSMRPAGAGMEAPAVVSESAELDGSTAYTFAALGRSQDLATDLLVDDLSPPPAGQATVRVVHAAGAEPTVDVAAVGGPVLASGLRFAGVTGYAAVPGQAWTLSVTDPAGADVAQRRIDLQPGQVVTVVLADDGDGVAVEQVVDATGMASAAADAAPVPSGGVDTGGGGTATPGPAPDSASPVVALGLVAAALGVTGLAVLGRTRRRATVPVP